MDFRILDKRLKSYKIIKNYIIRNLGGMKFLEKYNFGCFILYFYKVKVFLK